jgi:triacylglycerol lipase
MTRVISSHASKRTHVVLIPGFGGFDALGQLEYYGGLTELFGTVRADNEVLHYFDNFPTAAVVTRAQRLRE